MALIVEDGSGLPDAESYASVALATAYHASRGNAAWAAIATDADREAYLRRATDYMTQTYRTKWAGSRVTTTQALDWPRNWVPMLDAPNSMPPGYWGASYYASDDVPLAVSNACAELALKAIAGPLAPDLAAQATRKTVGPITVEYAQGSRQQVKYQDIEGMLQPFLKAGGGSVMLERV